jgi:hypothetical protein
MKGIKMTRIRMLLATCVLFVPAIGLATQHSGRQVVQLHSPDTRECTFFMLTGVAEADPVLPGNPWFAVPKTHVGYKEIVSFLMTARITGESLTVYTAGTTACGHATVSAVLL